MLLWRCRLWLRRPMLIGQVDDHIRGAMVKCLRHFPFVKRNPITRRAAEAVAADGVGPFRLLQLPARAEEAGVVCHVEHGRGADRPSFHLRIVDTIHEDRQAPVNGRGERCVPARSEYRCSPGVRIHTSEIRRGEREATFGVLKLGHVLEKKCTSGGIESPGWACNRHTELEAAVHVWKEGLGVEPGASVFEIVKRLQPPSRRDTLKERRGRLIGGYTGWGEEPGDAVRFDDLHRPFDEQRVEVHVTTGEQWIVAAGARHAHSGLGALLCLGVGAGEWVAGCFEGGDHALAVGGALREGNLAAADWETFKPLQLHTVPWRVADDGIEPARKRGALPIRPHTGKGDLPVEEALLGDQFAYLAKHLSQATRFGFGGLGLVDLCDRIELAHGDLNGIAVYAGEIRFENYPVVAGVELKPVQRMKQTEQRIEWCCHLLHFREHVRRAVRFGNLRVCETLDNLHR